MWKEGRIGFYFYEAKVFDEPSKFGINRGRISKLVILDSDRKTLCLYDRKWVIKPINDEVKDAVEKIMDLYE